MNERRRLLTEYIRDDADEELDYFTIIPYEGGANPCPIQIYGYVVVWNDGTYFISDMWYSIDGGQWMRVEYGDTVNVPFKSKLRLKSNGYDVLRMALGDNTNNVSQVIIRAFDTSNETMILIDGTPLSLLHGDDFKSRKNDLLKMCFSGLFYANYNISQINNPKTFLPSTVLADECYSGMFAGTPILNAPELPADILRPMCYAYMFNSCRYLTEAPKLIAEVNADMCYFGMFAGCYSLSYIKIGKPDNLNTQDYEYIVEASYDSIAIMPTELLDTELGYYFSNRGWTIIGDDYTFNDDGYPDTEIYDDRGYCFINADFVENDASNYLTLYSKEPSSVGLALYYDVMADYSLDKYIYINRKPFYFDFVSDGTVALKSNNVYGTYDYANVYSDGSISVICFDYLIYEYLKK